MFRDDFDGAELDTRVWVPALPADVELARRERGDVRGRRVRAAADDPARSRGCGARTATTRRCGSRASSRACSRARSGARAGNSRSATVSSSASLQPTQWGWTPHYGLLEVRARMDLGPRSMASVWMVGIEDRPERSGEICIFEVFGDVLEDGIAAVGAGVHPFRDPALSDEFDAPRMQIDVSQPHVYAADWRPGRVDFLIDGRRVKTVRPGAGLPDADDARGVRLPSEGDSDHVPELAVDHVRGLILLVSLVDYLLSGARAPRARRRTRSSGPSCG